MTTLLTGEQRPRCISAIARSHAGEILQGAIRRDNRTRRVLVSLPAPFLKTRADVLVTPGRPLSVTPETARKAEAALHHLLKHLKLPFPEITVALTTNIPLGKGCGSSTADILAAVRAVLKYLGHTMEESAIARLIVEVEEASDSTVLSQPTVFRHREGVVEEYLPSSLPDLRVMVIDTQPGIRVSTTAMQRARYNEAQLRRFDALIGELRSAMRKQCPRSVGAVATESALINELFLPKPHFRTLLDTVLSLGGYGLSAAHSGTVVAAMLPYAFQPGAQRQLHAAVERLGQCVVTNYVLKTPRHMHAAA